MKSISYHITLLWTVSLFSLTSCTQPVGGECKYGERVEGSATIKSIDERGCIVDFRPADRVWAEWSVEPRFQDISASCYVNNRKAGKTYMAIYEKELLGSCKPYRLIVYDRDTMKQYPNLVKIYGLK